MSKTGRISNVDIYIYIYRNRNIRSDGGCPKSRQRGRQRVTRAGPLIHCNAMQCNATLSPRVPCHCPYLDFRLTKPSTSILHTIQYSYSYSFITTIDLNNWSNVLWIIIITNIAICNHIIYS